MPRQEGKIIPQGIVSFLFTDIEGSTRLAQEYSETYNGMLQKHNQILERAIKRNDGFIFENVGDAFCCSFQEAASALCAAIESQRELAAESWDGEQIRVRMGMHTGPAIWDSNIYTGYLTMARTQRVLSSAWGGQILVTEEFFEAVKDQIDSTITFRDLGMRRLKDLRNPVKIFQVVAPEIQLDFPPIKSLDARPNNLPIQLSSFVGRKKEISEIREIIKSNSLVTLLGPGGAGKTRLALQIAADLIDEFANGVWFVDAAPLTDSGLLSQTVADALNLNERSGKSITVQLVEFLKDKQLLIVLDNCEHLISACSRLSETLLANCSGLKIIATSREALKNRGEHIYQVSSLSLPSQTKSENIESLTQYESVKLFIERALSIKPDFSVNNANAPALADICNKLDGIPLAIELAASRVKVLTLEQIHQRLDNRFSFLTGGYRSALPRQQTLKAMVDWSYDLLSEKERMLWYRLSVFLDGWTLQAAEEVCSDDSLDRHEILDLLSQLVDKSLVISNGHSERFRMLETIREYGETRLIEAGEAEKILLRHLDFFSAFAESGRKELEGPQQKEWLNKLETENHNFRNAFTTALTRGLRQKGLSLAISLGRYWEMRGRVTEAKGYFEEFLITIENVPLDLKANANQWMGTFEWITGNYARAETYYKESLASYKKLDNKRGIAVALNNLALIAQSRNDFLKAKQLNEEALDLVREGGDEVVIADLLLNLGAPLVNLDEKDYAEKTFKESLKIYNKIKDLRGTAMALSNLGMLKALESDFESASTYLHESLAILRDLNEKRSIAMTLDNLGSILGTLGHHDRAKEYLCESLQVNTELGDKRGISDSLNNLGFIEFLLKNERESFRLHKESLKMRMAIGNMQRVSYSLIGIAEVVAEREPEAAAYILGAAHETFISIEEMFRREIENVYMATETKLKEKLGEKIYQMHKERGVKDGIAEAVETVDELD